MSRCSERDYSTAWNHLAGNEVEPFPVMTAGPCAGRGPTRAPDSGDDASLWVIALAPQHCIYKRTGSGAVGGSRVVITRESSSFLVCRFCSSFLVCRFCSSFLVCRFCSSFLVCRFCSSFLVCRFCSSFLVCRFCSSFLVCRFCSSFLVCRFCSSFLVCRFCSSFLVCRSRAVVVPARRSFLRSCRLVLSGLGLTTYPFAFWLRLSLHLLAFGSIQVPPPPPFMPDGHVTFSGPTLAARSATEQDTMCQLSGRDRPAEHPPKNILVGNRARSLVAANPSCHAAIRFLWLLSHSGITRLACPCWKHVGSTMSDLAKIAGSRTNVVWNPMPGTSQIMRLTTPQRDEGNGTQETIHGRDERDNESIKDLMNTVAEFRTRRRSKNELWTEAQAEYEERAIPLNYHKLTQLIEKELQQSEKEHFRMVIKAVDAHLLTHYHGLLYEIQDLYFPMNPDSESRSDMEVPDVEDGCRKRKFFRLLSSLASAANYIRLSNKAVAFALTQHHRLDGPQLLCGISILDNIPDLVSVRLTEYDSIAFWALGEGPAKSGHDAWSKRPLHRRLLWRRHVSGPDRRVFARVMIFASITHGRTILKAFKDMPCTALDHTLPHVYPRVSILDRTLLTISLGVGGLAVFVNVYMVLMSDLKLQLTLTLLLFAGVLGARALAAYRRRRATHLLGLSRMLYYKNTSNNADLLTALAFRAHEQHLKEAMLVVALLLQNPAEGLTEVAIRQAVNAWLNRRCSRHVCTHPARSISALCAAGCLEVSMDNVAKLREPPFVKPSLGPASSA